MPGLALDRVPDPDERRIVQPAQTHEVRGGGDRPEGVAQFVGQHGQKFVFPPGLLLRLAVQPRVHDCHGGQLRQLNQDGLIPFGEVTFIFIGQCYEA